MNNTLVAHYDLEREPTPRMYEASGHNLMVFEDYAQLAIGEGSFIFLIIPFWVLSIQKLLHRSSSCVTSSFTIYKHNASQPLSTLSLRPGIRFHLFKHLTTLPHFLITLHFCDTPIHIYILIPPNNYPSCNIYLFFIHAPAHLYFFVEICTIFTISTYLVINNPSTISSNHLYRKKINSQKQPTTLSKSWGLTFTSGSLFITFLILAKGSGGWR